MNELPNSVDIETRSLWRSSIRRRCPFVTTVIVVVLNFGSGCRNKTFRKKGGKKNCRIEGFKRALMYCGFNSLSLRIIGPKMGIFFFFFSPSLVLGILEMGHMFYINIFIAVWFSGKNKQIELTSIHRAISPSPFSSFLFKEVLN